MKAVLGAPASLTQADVDALVKGGKGAAVANRRIAAVNAPKTPRTAAGSSKKSSPPKLRKKDLAALRSGKASAALRARVLTATTETAGEAAGYGEGPTLTPPKRSSKG